MTVEYHGITTHNLKNIDFSFEEGKIIIIKGVSGSGKSSLAIDTIYQISEDELSIITHNSEMRSSYSIYDYNNILPAVCLRQENYNTNPRSTIGSFFGVNLFFQNIYSYVNSISRELLRFNNPDVACKECHGIGSVLAPSINDIVDFFSPLSKKAIKIWLGKNSDYYYKLLVEFCKDNNIDMSIPVFMLSEKDQQSLLYGKSQKKYTTKYVSAGVKHSKTAQYTGAVSFALDLLQKQNISRAQKSFFIEEVCRACKGGRYSDELSQYKVWGKSLPELYLMEFDQLACFFTDNLKKTSDIYLHTQCNHILKFIKAAIKNKLGYLNMNRSIPSLSGGEYQRLCMTKVCITHFRHFLYILDEPTASLHPCERGSVADTLLEVKKRQNTILVVEHSDSFDKIADKIVCLGPGAGVDGGEIISKEVLDANRVDQMKYHFLPCKSWIGISFAKHNNVLIKDGLIPYGSLVGICGISGSGKSSFAKRILPRYIQNCTYICQDPIRGNSYSTVASFLGLSNEIEDFFSEKTKKKNVYFKYYNEGTGQCAFCKGIGRVVERSIRWVSENVCPECKGKRFSQKTLSFYWSDMNIYDFMNQTIEQASRFFDRTTQIGKTLRVATQFGLGYLRLFQNTENLSGGEAQRIKMIAYLSKYKRARNYILDEPFRGVDPQNTSNILSLFVDMVKQGNSIFVVEHNPMVLAQCSYIIEFGPGSGSKGGNMLFAGSKDDFIQKRQSSIIPFLKKYN